MICEDSRVAQWLERWSYEPSVEGSTPSSRRLNFFFFTTTLYFIFYFLLPKIFLFFIFYFLFFIFYFLQLGIPTLFYFLIFRKLEIIITIQETKTAPGSSRKVLQRGLCRYSCTTQLHRWPSKLNRSLRSCTCRYNAAAAGGGGFEPIQYNTIQYNTIMTGHRQYARLAITTMVFLATASSSSSDIALEQHSFKAALETAWNASGTGVNVIAASPGTWPPPPPSPSCAAPKVWFFLCGHYRSHSVTQHSLKAMAEATAAGATSGQRSFCYMAAALMPDELDHSKLLSAVGSKGIQRFGQKWDV